MCKCGPLQISDENQVWCGSESWKVQLCPRASFFGDFALITCKYFSRFPIELFFTPRTTKEENFNLICNVKHKVQPLNVNVKAEGYTMSCMVLCEDSNNGKIELSQRGVNEINFGDVSSVFHFFLPPSVSSLSIQLLYSSIILFVFFLLFFILPSFTLTSEKSTIYQCLKKSFWFAEMFDEFAKKIDKRNRRLRFLNDNFCLFVSVGDQRVVVAKLLHHQQRQIQLWLRVAVEWEQCKENGDHDAAERLLTTGR